MTENVHNLFNFALQIHHPSFLGSSHLALPSGHNREQDTADAIVGIIHHSFGYHWPSKHISIISTNYPTGYSSVISPGIVFGLILDRFRSRHYFYITISFLCPNDSCTQSPLAGTYSWCYLFWVNDGRTHDICVALNRRIHAT